MNLEELYIQRNEYARQGDIKEAEEITHQIDDMLPSKEKNVLILTERYCPEKYPKYDNYDAINVDKVKDIPYDYDGVMGVPITFLSWYRPGVEILCPAEEQMNHQSYIKLFSVPSCLKDTQFEILWLASGHSKTTMPKEIAEMLNADFEMKSKENTGNGYAILDKHQLYHRILIRRR